MNDEQPTCGDCRKVMTPENSTAAPEYFLCDECAHKRGIIKPQGDQVNTPHTPGPWQIHETDDSGRWAKYRIATRGLKTGMTIAFAMDDIPSGMANARLIASAPQLLSQRNELRAALQRLLTCYESHFPVGSELTQARVALNHAKD